MTELHGNLTPWFLEQVLKECDILIHLLKTLLMRCLKKQTRAYIKNKHRQKPMSMMFMSFKTQISIAVPPNAKISRRL